MKEVIARAGLKDPADSGDSLTATVSRREIEEVLGSEDGEPELLLDVAYSLRDNGHERQETRKVAVAWDRSDLATLLRQAHGDRVSLAIDRDSIERALEESDVEAHGLREKILVFTVVAATAAGAAGSAQAVVDPGGGGPQPSAAAQYSAIEDLRADALAPGDAAAQLGYSVEDVYAPGDAAAQLGYSTEDVWADQPGAPADTSAPLAYAIEDVRSEQPLAPATAAEPSGGFEITAPSPAEAAGIGAAIALAITGAAFVVRTRRRVGPAS